MSKQKTITEWLREAVNEAIQGGSTFRDLERETGVIRQSLMPFARGECSLRLDKADLLAAHFGLEMKPANGKERR